MQIDKRKGIIDKGKGHARMGEMGIMGLIASLKTKSLKELKIESGKLKIDCAKREKIKN